ncbi:amino acid ABC transporter substrate-binding protein [Candidatus Dependentiae bacterium]|nr:amino acid ABC transporter substrate-binding protein [Candidatus Dependentiae bacterium]
MKIQNIIFILFIACIIAVFYKKYCIVLLKDESTLIVGTSADYPPYEFMDTKTGDIVGFDIDVIREIALRLNKNILIKNLSFTTLIFALMAGEIDVIAAGMSPSKRRSKFVLFTDSYLDNDYYVVVSKKDRFNPGSLDDLVGKDVVVNTGHAAEAFMAKQKGVQLIRLKDVSLGLVALTTGSVDAFVSVKSVIDSALKKKNNYQQFVVLPLWATGDDCSFAVQRHNKELAYNIDKVLFEMKHDGTLDRLKNKWNL